VSLTVRRAVPADLELFLELDQRGFGVTNTESWAATMRRLMDMDRFLFAEEDGQAVAVAGALAFPMGVPGGQVDVAGVTAVSVLPTHRRRGALRALMHAQLTSLRDNGCVLAALTASQGTIYTRYGYGAATEYRQVRIDRRFAAFRPEAPDAGGVRMISADEARGHAPQVHARWAAITPASVLRHEALWDLQFADHPEERRGLTAAFHLAHPDGYATYRMDVPRRACLVSDVFAATPEAHAALWRVLLGNDMVDVVEADRACPPGDPLAFLLTDNRTVETLTQRDAVWMRLVDPAAALAARRYATDVDLVLDVLDPVLSEKTRVRLTGGPDGAACVPSSAPPDVTLGTSALASAYQGHHHVAALARSGLVEGTPQVVARMDAAFGWPREPSHGTGF
jgi:predicted acetyltransferase